MPGQIKMSCPASIQLESIEKQRKKEINKLLQMALKYETFDNRREQLIGEAESDGYIGDDAIAIVDETLKRADHPQKQSKSKLGVAQDPNVRVQRLAQTIAAMRY